MAEQIGVIENILRNGKRMWGGGWENCKDGGKTYNKKKTEMLDKTILPPYRLGKGVRIFFWTILVVLTLSLSFLCILLDSCRPR